MNSYYEKILATGEVKCIDEEIPFEIPRGWEWCRIASLADVVRGGSPRPAGSPIFYDGSIPFLKVADLTRESSIYVKSFSSTIKEAGLSKTRLVEAGTLLLTNSGATLGVPKICTFDTTFNDGVAAFLSLDERLKLYVYWFFCYMTDLYRNINQGTAQPNLNTDIIKMTLVPIPPYKEQVRIIEQLGNISPIIEHYEKAQDELDELNESIPKLIKQSILQEAIRGKLVPQIAEEGTAQELLEQIKAEKQKLVKEGKLKKSALASSVIFRGDDNKYWEKNGKDVVCIDAEIPFEVPSSWIWCRMGDCVSIIGGYAFKSYDLKSSLGIRVIRISDISEKGLVNKNIVKYNGNEDLTQYLIKRNDILIAMTGGTVGKSLLLTEKLSEPLLLNQRVAIIRNIWINVEYLNAFLHSPYIKQIIDKKKNSTNDNISMSDLNGFLIPLPPLKEQYRIVERYKNVTSIMS